MESRALFINEKYVRRDSGSMATASMWLTVRWEIMRCLEWMGLCRTGSIDASIMVREDLGVVRGGGFGAHDRWVNTLEARA